jgi:hypothetical protein
MHTASVRRTILFILLAVLTAAWPSSAAPAQRNSSLSAQADERTMIPEIFDRLWSFLRRAESKDGCHIDPLGRCVPEQKPTHRKEGCNIDPWGRCVP